jgi:hypothetical protein
MVLTCPRETYQHIYEPDPNDYQSGRTRCPRFSAGTFQAWLTKPQSEGTSP